MKAIAITQAAADGNNIPSLTEIDLPIPTAHGRDLLVAVKAISVNPVDTKVRAGFQGDTPRVLGWDAVGVVQSVGEEVTLFAPGDEVWYAGALGRAGSNSEYQLVDERLVSHKPRTLDNASAAALPLTAITAWELLFHRLGVEEGGNAGDTLLWDYSDSGIDLIESAIMWTLGAYQENLTLTGQAGTGNGNAGANWVIGNTVNNVLRGMGGHDSVLGAAGNDILFGNDGGDKLNGGAGNDIIVGGAGADWLIGHAGADRFQFFSVADSAPGWANRDFIDDFGFAQGDRIDLQSIDANTALAGNQAFTFIGLADFNGQAGQLCYDRVNGDLVVSGDVNGDRTADFQLVLDDLSGTTAASFLL